MWQFSQAIDGLGEACTALGTPITGGNVSFYNETLGKSIYPTPVIGVLGILDDASCVLKIPFREEGDIILLLDGAGPTAGARYMAPSSLNVAREFSSSEYSKTIGGIVAGEPPAIDLSAEKRLIDCLVALAAEGSIQSAHDISDGGLAVTLAESCFATNGFGANAKFEENGPLRRPSLANAAPARSYPSPSLILPVFSILRDNTKWWRTRSVRSSAAMLSASNIRGAR